MSNKARFNLKIFVLALVVMIGTGFVGRISAEETELQAITFSVDEFMGAQPSTDYDIPIMVNADAGETVTTVQLDLNVDPRLTSTLTWSAPWSPLQACTSATAEDCFVGFNFAGSAGSFQVATLTITTPADCKGEYPINFDIAGATEIGEFGTGYNGIPADAISGANLACDLTAVELSGTQTESGMVNGVVIAMMAMIALGGLTVAVSKRA